MQLAELRALKPQILAIAEKYGVSNIRVFGSVARGEANEGSDVDLLVDMQKASLFELGGFKYDMEFMLGSHVDVVKPGAIRHPLMRQRIFAEAQPL